MEEAEALLLLLLLEVVVAWLALLFLPLRFPEISGPFSIMAGMGGRRGKKSKFKKRAGWGWGGRDQSQKLGGGGGVEE